jgi:hypothetical protein
MPTPKSTKLAATLAVLEAGQQTQELTVTLEGDNEPLVFRYRPLGWLAKSRAISDATEFVAKPTKDGKDFEVSSVFHLDRYKVVALRAMLVDPPIPMSDQILENLPPEIGEQFDAIIPDPFTVPKVAAAVKKG